MQRHTFFESQYYSPDCFAYLLRWIGSSNDVDLSAKRVWIATRIRPVNGQIAIEL
jgi:hypothetical protein